MAAVLVRFGSNGGVEFDATRELGGAGEAGRADSEFRGMLLRVFGRERPVHDCRERGMVDERGRVGITKKGLVAKTLWELRAKSRGW